MLARRNVSPTDPQETRPMQLDIFEHSRDVMLRNDVIEALARHDGPAARAACDRLAAECPADESLIDLRGLLEVIDCPGPRTFEDHAALNHARQVVEQAQPRAERVFGRETTARWLSPILAELAVGAEALPFRADSADDHAAPLYLRAGNWHAAVEAVTAIPSWRRIPAPLAWMAQARLQMVGLQSTWPLIAELGWLSPPRLDDLLRRSQDPMLSALARKFGERFEGEGTVNDAAWFPAWALTERPEIANHASAAQPSQHTAPERAFRTLVELLGLERQGRQRDIVERRKTLRDLQPSLYEAYMRTR